ncbi:MAG: ADP-ribosylation factor-like protein [Candidatus Hermodarchaeota archaeon]|nr:ADP-ribosylation factor-like protein [Candidatus Hermodarchaeota archaeon]
MIHHVFIIDARDEIVVQKKFWIITINQGEMQDFAGRVQEAQDSLIEEIGPIKYIGKPLGRGVVVLCAESVDDDDTLREKLDRVTYEFRRVISYEVEYEDFMAKVDDYVVTTLKVSIIGYGGVGKTTLVTLLNGGVPPTSYVPTIAIDIQKIEGARIGTYEISTWDFAGQDRFRKLWELYFRGSRIILLVTDSTLENVLNSKDIIDLIRRKDIAAELLAIANKQDLPGALSPQLVQRILGIKAYGMVAIDPNNREKALDIINEALKLAAPKEEIVVPKPVMDF